MKAIALLLLALTAACACPTTYTLDSKWKPLTRIEQRSQNLPGSFATEGVVIYSNDDLCSGFLSWDVVEQDGLLVHEQYHANRQATVGIQAFLARYKNDIDFRWQEESAGWTLQLIYVTKHGNVVDIPACAKFLSESYNEGDDFHRMIGYNEALIWVTGIVSAAKKP